MPVFLCCSASLPICRTFPSGTGYPQDGFLLWLIIAPAGLRQIWCPTAGAVGWHSPPSHTALPWCHSLPLGTPSTREEFLCTVITLPKTNSPSPLKCMGGSVSTRFIHPIRTAQELLLSYFAFQFSFLSRQMLIYFKKNPNLIQNQTHHWYESHSVINSPAHQNRNVSPCKTIVVVAQAHRNLRNRNPIC